VWGARGGSATGLAHMASTDTGVQRPQWRADLIERAAPQRGRAITHTPPVHSSRSEQPTQESPLQTRAACRTDYVTRTAAPEAVGHICPHDCAPARAHVAPRHHVLIVCAQAVLKRRALQRRALLAQLRMGKHARALTQARARIQCACSLTQCAHARYLRSWTRCRRSDRALTLLRVRLCTPSLPERHGYHHHA
jgi:hypothetical protein